MRLVALTFVLCAGRKVYVTRDVGTNLRYDRVEQSVSGSRNGDVSEEIKEGSEDCVPRFHCSNNRINISTPKTIFDRSKWTEVGVNSL